MEYADCGTLRDYLKNNFNTMDKKCQLAFQIASAVECLISSGQTFLNSGHGV